MVNGKQDIFAGLVHPSPAAPVLFFKTGAFLLFFASEISKIEEYFNSTINFYRYYTSGSTIQDHVYFIRNIKTFCNGSDYSLHYLDYRTSTKYDFIAAKINAYSQLMVYLKNEIDKLSEPLEKRIEPKQIKQLTWTESNVSLVEICSRSPHIFNSTYFFSK